MRTDTTKVWDLNAHFRKALPDTVTLGSPFKNRSYASANALLFAVVFSATTGKTLRPSWKYERLRPPRLVRQEKLGWFCKMKRSCPANCSFAGSLPSGGWSNSVRRSLGRRIRQP